MTTETSTDIGQYVKRIAASWLRSMLEKSLAAVAKVDYQNPDHLIIAITKWWHAMRPEERPEYVDIVEVARGALRLTEIEKLDLTLRADIAKAMNAIGFEKRPKRYGGVRIQVYWPGKDLRDAPYNKASKAVPPPFNK